MKVTFSYKVKLLYNNPDKKLLKLTVDQYRNAVSFLIDCINKEWDSVHPVYSESTQAGQRLVESFTHCTSVHPNPKYDFAGSFPKFPSYYRRSAISAALGAVSSYQSSIKNWVAAGKKTKEPSLTLDRNVMPAFFRHNMGKVDDMLAGKTDFVSLKLYNGHNWIWVSLQCRRQDVKYLGTHWAGVKSCAPVLEIDHVKAHTSDGWHKPGKKVKHKRCNKNSYNKYYLRFAYEETRDLNRRNVPLKDRTVLAVDLGINTCATCSVMKSDGTVIARKFIDFPVEKDRLEHLVNKVKRAQREHGRTGGKREWAKATRCIVFEHLNTNGRKRGKNKQKLHLWRKNTIQKIAEHKAHRDLMRISHICAWKTSKLAFDGSGEVKRYVSNDGQQKNYSLCTFKNGKMYNCDLSASYNIGARYFLRAWCSENKDLKKDIPSAVNRTWSDLWNLFHKKPEQAA